MRVWPEEDEFYPWWSINDHACRNPGSEARTKGIEVDEATVERWRRVIAEAVAVMDEIDAATEAAGY